MYTVKVKLRFSSAHNLRGYKGKCEALHGHNWHVELSASSEDLDKTGMVADFTELKGILKGILERLDHKYLNELDDFKEINPTSENIARFIYERAAEKLSGINIKEVTVWETDSSAATYSKR